MMRRGKSPMQDVRRFTFSNRIRIPELATLERAAGFG
jgi:hypothetical protein